MHLLPLALLHFIFQPQIVYTLGKNTHKHQVYAATVPRWESNTWKYVHIRKKIHTNIKSTLRQYHTENQEEGISSLGNCSFSRFCIFFPTFKCLYIRKKNTHKHQVYSVTVPEWDPRIGDFLPAHLLLLKGERERVCVCVWEREWCLSQRDILIFSLSKRHIKYLSLKEKYQLSLSQIRFFKALSLSKRHINSLCLSRKQARKDARALALCTCPCILACEPALALCLAHLFLHLALQTYSSSCLAHLLLPCTPTGWRRLIGSPKLQIIFHKRATKYRALLRKMSYKDKGSYESSPPCTLVSCLRACSWIKVLYKVRFRVRGDMQFLAIWSAASEIGGNWHFEYFCSFWQ